MGSTVFFFALVSISPAYWAVSNFVSEENLVLLDDYRNYTLFIWFRRKVRINTIRKAQLNRFWTRVLVCVIELLWFGMRWADLIGLCVQLPCGFALFYLLDGYEGTPYATLVRRLSMEKHNSRGGIILIGLNEHHSRRLTDFYANWGLFDGKCVIFCYVFCNWNKIIHIACFEPETMSYTFSNPSACVTPVWYGNQISNSCSNLTKIIPTTI